MRTTPGGHEGGECERVGTACKRARSHVCKDEGGRAIARARRMVSMVADRRALTRVVMSGGRPGKRAWCEGWMAEGAGAVHDQRGGSPTSFDAGTDERG